MHKTLHMNTKLNTKFMADGVLFSEEFSKSRIKILWILKEPYGDLPEHLADGIQERLDGKKKDSPHTWQRLALTSYMILQGYEGVGVVPPWSVYGRSLKEIAIINVKKKPGKSTTNMVEFRKFYKANKEIMSYIVREQIAEINPDVVIGGGTLHLIKDDLGDRHDLGRGHFRIGSRLFINTWHPAQRKLGMLEYSKLVASRAIELLQSLK